MRLSCLCAEGGCDATARSRRDLIERVKKQPKWSSHASTSFSVVVVPCVQLKTWPRVSALRFGPKSAYADWSKSAVEAPRNFRLEEATRTV